MTIKLNQTQIFFGVISLTLGIMAGSVGLGYFLGHNNTNTQKAQVATSQNPKSVEQNLANDTTNSATSIAQNATSKPSPTSSAATTAVTLDIADSKTEIKDAETKSTDLKTKIGPQTQTLKNLKITLDKIDFTKTTPFQDPNSTIKDDETFALLNITLENISDKNLDLDARAYLIEILDAKLSGALDSTQPKQVVYKPARELGPSFSQSKSTLIRKNLQPGQKFSGVVGFKIPQETATLNFYYPDVFGSKDIALFKLR